MIIVMQLNVAKNKIEHESIETQSTNLLYVFSRYKEEKKNRIRFLEQSGN